MRRENCFYIMGGRLCQRGSNRRLNTNGEGGGQKSQKIDDVFNEGRLPKAL